MKIDKSKFDQEVYEFYKAALEGAGFAAQFSAEDIPRMREAEITGHAAHLDPYEVYEKIDLAIPREGAGCLPARIYVPEDAADAAGQVPMILYFHGGGFIMGSIEDHDPLCGKLADAAGAIVIAAEYRLAPEHPFPACIEDAAFLAKWAFENAAQYGGDPQRIMAAGDSSGATISAALALLANNSGEISANRKVTAIGGAAPAADEKTSAIYGNTSAEGGQADSAPKIPESKGEQEPSISPISEAIEKQTTPIPSIAGLILLYGIFGSISFEDSESAKLYGQGDYVLPVAAVKKMMDLYIPAGTDPNDARLYPGKATDLSSMPPTVIITAELDPLRDDGECFARRLKDSGCRAELIRMEGMMHGFALYWQRFKKAEALLDHIGSIIKGWIN